MQPVLELRIVHMRPPGIQAEGIPVAREGHHLLVAHRITDRGMPANPVTARRASRRVVPSAAVEFSWVGIEQMRKVAFFAVGKLDAERIDKNQPVELRVAAYRKLGGEPAAKRKAEQRHFFR